VRIYVCHLPVVVVVVGPDGEPLDGACVVVVVADVAAAAAAAAADMATEVEEDEKCAKS
jgi:hypothetical protein